MAILILFFVQNASADYFEFGLAGNYRKVHLSDSTTSQDAYDENYAYVGTFAYYFREMTALELSYSMGRNTRSAPSDVISSTTVHDYSMYGADLVFTFGKRTDDWIPYVKGGVAYFDKKDITYQYTDHTNANNSFNSVVKLKPTLVPSAGLGMQLKLTSDLFFKFGIEMWTSGPVDKDIKQFDWAGRVGISWFL